MGDVVMDDAAYRSRLAVAGVSFDKLDGATSHQLDCIGNLVGVYRTSMREQNPSRYRIMEAARQRGVTVTVDIFESKEQAGERAMLEPAAPTWFGRTSDHLPALTPEWFRAATTPRTHDPQSGTPIYALTPPRTKTHGWTGLIVIAFIIACVAMATYPLWR